MNLAVRRFILFFFSVSILSACEEPSDIGIDLVEENLIGASFTDTLTINSSTVLLNDSILSFNQPVSLVGKYNDPALGPVAATTFTEVGLGANNLSFGENRTLDSLVLALDYSLLTGFSYGDTTTAITLRVHRLNQQFDERTSYFTNSTLSYDDTPLGTVSFRPRTIVTRPDNNTTKTQAPLRIRISNDFATELLALSGSSTLATQQNFNNFLNGLALVADNGGAPGYILAVNLGSQQSALTLYYKSGTETTQKTHAFNFRDTGIDRFNNIRATREGTAVAGLQQKGDEIAAEALNGESYIQSTTQLLTKIAIPHLLKIKEQQGNIIINRAELVVPVRANSRENNLPAPTQLVLYRTNNNNRILRTSTGDLRTVQGHTSAATSVNAYASIFLFSPDRNEYRVNLTPYVQGVMLGNFSNNELLLGPVNVTPGQNQMRTVSTDPRPYRAIISNTEARPMKLLLYYSKLN